MDRVNGALAELSEEDEPEITMTPGTPPEPAAPPSYVAPLPGMTPAYAGAGAGGGAAPSEP
ncbi:MAG: hypothetical protein ABIY55_05530, partial [Kofleriaceae bacterium]